MFNDRVKELSNNLLSASWVTGISSIIITSIGLSDKNVGVWVFGIILLLLCFVSATMSYKLNKPVTYSSFISLCETVAKLEKHIMRLESQEINEHESVDTPEDAIVV